MKKLNEVINEDHVCDHWRNKDNTHSCDKCKLRDLREWAREWYKQIEESDYQEWNGAFQLLKDMFELTEADLK